MSPEENAVSISKRYIPARRASIAMLKPPIWSLCHRGGTPSSSRSE